MKTLYFYPTLFSLVFATFIYHSSQNEISQEHIEVVHFFENDISFAIGNMILPCDPPCNTCGVCTTPGPNLVVNGDFDQGDTGFTSDLTSSCTCLFSSYCIATIATAKCNVAQWQPITSCTGAGNYMVVDGSNAVIWRQNVTVEANKTYNFSFAHYPNVSGSISLPILELRVAGSPILSNIMGMGGAWGTFCANYFSPFNGQVTLEIAQTGGAGFNDYGIDDIQFSACEPVISVEAMDDQSICFGESITLETVITSATGNYTCIWAPTAGLNDPTSCNPTFTPIVPPSMPQPIVFTVTVNEGGCIATDQVTITVLPEPTAIAINSGPVCETGILTLNEIGGQGVNWLWLGPNGFSSNLKSPTITNVGIQNGGLYDVIVTDANGCVSTSSTTVTINPLPEVDAGSNSPICEGEDLELYEFANAGISYTWIGPNGYTSNEQNPIFVNVTSQNAGLYTVIVTDANGCVNSQDIDVTIEESPDVQLSSNSPVCEGEDLNLSEQGGDGDSWQWEGPDNFISTLQNPVIQNVSLDAAGFYFVTVTASNGCTSVGEIEVEIIETFDVQASSNSPVCEGEEIFLFEDIGEGEDYFWTGPNGFTSNDQNPSIFPATLDDSGIYTVTVTKNGCTVTDDVEVIVEECCCIDFDIFCENVDSGFEYFIDCNEISINPLSFDECYQVDWDWGDGSTGPITNANDIVTHTYDTTGSYTVCMIVTEFQSGEPCWDPKEYCEEIEILPEGSISGNVYEDLNGNHQVDAGEDPFANILVILQLPDGTIQTTLTNASGFYTFQDLPAGDYIVSAGSSVSNTHTSYPQIINVELEICESVNNQDFFLTPFDAYGCIKGAVIFDLDNDGLRDYFDLGIPNMQIAISGNGVNETLTSDATGNFMLSLLLPGTYQVTILTAPTNAVLTSGDSFQVEVKAEICEDNVLFTFIPEADFVGITGIVAYDPDCDGIFDPNTHTVIGNARVVLKDENGTILDDTLSGMDGLFVFYPLPPGTYTIEILDDFPNTQPSTPTNYTWNIDANKFETGNFLFCPLGPTFECGMSAMTCNVLYGNVFDHVLAVKDTRDRSNAPINTKWIPPLTITNPQWNAQNMGTVFGLAIDKDYNIYTSQTDVYSEYSPSYVGGKIFKVDAVTHAVSTLATLPNTGSGLGNICYVEQYDRLYVTNFEDGKIYWIHIPSGTVSSLPYDFNNPHNSSNLNNPPFENLGERVWAVAYHSPDNRLYFSVWNQNCGFTISSAPVGSLNNQVYSIQLDANGDFPSNTSTENLEIDLPPLPGKNHSDPVSDIAFSNDFSTMILAEKSVYEFQFSSLRQRPADLFPNWPQARLFEYTDQGSNWGSSPSQQYYIGVEPGSNGQSAVGGIDYGYDNFTNPPTIPDCDTVVYATGNALELTYVGGAHNVFGMAIIPASGNTLTNLNSVIIDAGPSSSFKTELGDVEVFKCGCPNGCNWSANVSYQHISCNGANDGVASAAPTNGTPPYTYLWNDPGNSTTPTISGLAPGNYCVTVTDDDMCQIVTCGDILEAGEIVLTISNQTNIDCNNPVGSATVIATGGTVSTIGYTYNWSNGFVETTLGGSTNTFITGGTYTVTVTDENGCTETTIVEITETSSVMLTLDSKTDIDCNNPKGSATVLATGGLQGIVGYQFDWSTGFVDHSFDYSTETFTLAGTYSVTVTDALGCTDELSFTINSTPIPTAFFAYNLISPCGETYAFTDQSIGNGLTYSWDFGDGSPLSTQTSPIHTYANSGLYTVTLTVTDVNGCDVTHSETFMVNKAIDVEIDCTSNCLDVSCNVVSGVATWYNWDWGDGNTSSGTTTPTHTYTNPGTYQVCLTALSIDCSDTACQTITVAECPCDSLGHQVIAHQAPQNGQDCYSLDIDVGLPGPFLILAKIQVSGVTFSNIQFDPLTYGTSLNGTADELEIFAIGQGFNPGLDPNAIQFCLSGVPAGCQVPIVFEWYQKNALDIPEKICEQEIVFECFEITDCIDIENSCIICEDGVYKLYYEFTNTTAFPICELDPSYLDPQVTFSPDPITFTPCINPGMSSGQQCITLDNLTPNTDLKIAFTTVSNILPDPGSCETDTLCLTIPECCDTTIIDPVLCCDTPVDILFIVDNSGSIDMGEFNTVVKNIENAMVDLDIYYCDPLYAVSHYVEIPGFTGLGVPFLFIEHDFTSSAIAQSIVRPYPQGGGADLNSSLGFVIDALNGVPNGGIDSGGLPSFANRRPGADLLIVVMTDDVPVGLLPYNNSNTLKSAPFDAQFTVVQFEPSSTVDHICAAIASPGGAYTGPVDLNTGDPQPPINASNPRQYIMADFNSNFIPVVDNITPCTRDFMCCDDLMIIDTLVQADSCCYSIDLKNKVGASITKLEVEVLTNDWIFNSGTLVPGNDFQWACPPSNQLLCLEHVSGNIPIGTTEDALSFCLAPTNGNAPTSQQIVFRWYQTLPGSMEEVICTDTLNTNCPPVFEDCISIIDPVLTCNPNNPYEYFMNFKVTNHSSFTATSVALQNLPPGFGFAFCNSSTAVSSIALPISPLPPTQTSPNLCVKIISPVPILSPQSVCFRGSLWSSFDCCHSPSLTCVDLVPCCDPCEDTDIIVDSISVNMAECCYKLDIVNGCGYQFFNRIETEVITNGVCFGYHALGGPDAANWFISSSTKNKISWEHSSGMIPNGTIDDIIQFCLDDIDDPSEIPQEVVVRWYTPIIGGDSLACVDTLTFNCQGENECLITSDHMIECIPDSNKYRLTFTLTNNSTIPFKATDLFTSVEPPSSLFLTPSGGIFPLNPPLCTGDSRTITTCIESTSGSFPPPETQIVLRHRLAFFNGTSADTCCYESVLDTIPLSCSGCCVDFDDFCDKVNQGFNVSVSGCTVTINAPQFDSCHWFGMEPDWDDGTIGSTVVIPATGTWTHTYAQSGTYNICVTVFEQDPLTGFDCWIKQMCTPVTVACDTTDCTIDCFDNASWNQENLGSFLFMLDMIPYNGDLVLAARQSSIGGSYVVNWDGTTAAPLGDGLNDDVMALEIHNGVLYAGGKFNASLGGTTLSGLAYYDNGAGQWKDVGGGVDLTSGFGVRALQSTPAGLMVAGDFTTVGGGTSANNIALWDGSTWSPLGAGTNGQVTGLGMFAGDLIVGGHFSTPANNVAVWNFSSWSPLGGGVSIPGTNFYNGVWAIQEYNGELYIGGNFTDAINTGIACPPGIVPGTHNIAKWNPTTNCWESVSGGVTGSFTAVYDMKVVGGNLVTAGVFNQMGGLSINSVAHWDGTQWHDMGHPSSNLLHAITCLPDATNNCEIYVGGESPLFKATFDCDCCSSFDDFCDKVDLGFTISIDSACKVTITAPQFDSCQWFTTPPDLGDGTPVGSVVVPANGMWMHTYAQNGTYNICATVFEQDPVTGDTCWTKQMCTPVTIDCHSECCDSFDDLCDKVDLGFTIAIDTACKVTITAPQFDSCHWFTSPPDPGDGTPVNAVVVPANGMWMHTYTQNGTYNICATLFEEDPVTGDSCWSKQMCTPVTINCFGGGSGFCDTLTTVSHPYLGYSVATCFSGLDQFGGQYVLARMDTRDHQSAPLNSNWDSWNPLVRYHGPANNWNATNLGEIFGIALDLYGNIYVASSAIYNYIPVGWGVAGEPSIYKIDGLTGNISVFNTTTLPNQKDVNLGSTLNGHEPGFGNICYNPIHDVFYVSNFEDGAIYVLEGATGNTIGTLFDPVPGDTRNGFEPVGDRVFGLGFNLRDNRLYYSVWNIDGYHKPTSGERNEIWMVDIKSDGTIDGGTETLVQQLPLINTFGRNFSNPVADIAFSADGNKMLLGERTIDQSRPDFFFAHDSRVLEYTWDGSTWNPEAVSKYQIDTNGEFSAGGVDYGYRDPKLQVCDTVVFASGDDIHQQAIHGDEIYGIQIIPGTGGDVSVSKIIDLNNNTIDRDKTGIGDVEIFKDPCCGVDSTNVCQLAVDVTAGDIVCANNDLQLTTNITGAIGSFSCSWFPTTNLSSANDCSPIFNATTPGIYVYTITVIDSQGCIATETIKVEVEACNVCCIDEQDFINRVNDGFTFQVSCFSIEAIPNSLTECHSVIWDLGDGSGVIGPFAGDNPIPISHTYSANGIYQLCMTVEEIDDVGTQCFGPLQVCQNVNINCICLPYQADCIVLNDNLVYNGNFELGNTGFGSQLAPMEDCADRSYAVAKNAQDKCATFDELYAPECEGNFMIVEGNDGIVTIHSVPVIQGQEYGFAFDFYPGLNGSGSPIFAVYIEGEAILPDVIGTSQEWNTACATWTSTKTGLASLSIHQVGSNGNAIYGIDNIILQTPPNDVVEIVDVKSMHIYPNPTSNSITLQFINHELVNGDIIQVFDMNGREIKSIQNTTSNNVFEVYLGSVPSGIYFLKAISNNQTFSGKVIKLSY